MTLLPLLAEASQLQHVAADKKICQPSIRCGETDLILMSLLRLCEEELNTFYFLQHTLTVVLRWLEIRVRAGVGAGAGVGRAGLDRLNPHKREKEKKNLNLSNPQNQHKAQ